jgi:hypothetical protein
MKSIDLKNVGRGGFKDGGEGCGFARRIAWEKNIGGLALFTPAKCGIPETNLLRFVAGRQIKQNYGKLL